MGSNNATTEDPSAESCLIELLEALAGGDPDREEILLLAATFHGWIAAGAALPRVDVSAVKAFEIGR